MAPATIDVATLEHRSDEQRERLRAACADGAFFLTGHGVPQPAIDALLAAGRAFFALPQCDRDAIDMIHSPYFRGYSAAGTERTQGRPDVREQFDAGPEEAPRGERDPRWLMLHGPNLWPHAQPGLKPLVLDWMLRLRALSIQLVQAIAQTIELPADTFAGAFSGQPHERLKIIRYPATGAEPPQGVGEHSDSGMITLIVDDGAAGLQIESGAAFVDVSTPRGSMLVITGRALQAATGGAVRAPRHRVCAPPRSPDRLSVAYFLNPRLDYAGYGDEALAVVLRSHPRTAQRFFGDLVPAG